MHTFYIKARQPRIMTKIHKVTIGLPVMPSYKPFLSFPRRKPFTIKKIGFGKLNTRLKLVLVKLYFVYIHCLSIP